MAHKDNLAAIVDHHRHHASAEQVEGGTRYTLHDVTPIQGAEPQHTDPLDRVVDNIHKAAHRWFTRNQNTE